MSDKYIKKLKDLFLKNFIKSDKLKEMWEPSEQEIHDAIDKLVPNNASLNDLVKSVASREGK
jgi:hypothetical protein